MADVHGQAWAKIAARLAPELPEGWAVRGGRGVSAKLVREPLGWTFPWVGLSRSRVADPPWLLTGVITLTGPADVWSARHGLRSDAVLRPGTVDMSAEDALERVRGFILDEALPRVDQWNEESLAESAELNLAAPADRRGNDFLDAAGWRVVRGTGSPVEPAREAIDFFSTRLSPDDVSWYEGLIAAWEQGERAAAMAYLEEQRQSSLRSLKLA